MAKSITETGPLSYRDLQTINAIQQMTGNALNIGQPIENPYIKQAIENNYSIEDYKTQSPIMRNSRGKDWWGNSFFDDDILVGTEAIENMQDRRAENQPWFSKIINGVGKAGVLAGTTALESVGLVLGTLQGLNDAYYAKDGTKWDAFMHSVWDNPFTQALQKINELSEKYMPNYYTQDEQENPWGHIFSANFLGDKLIKNFGFMVGAFYGGIPASKGIGAIGKAAVKSQRAALEAKKAGLAAKFASVTSGYSDDVIREAKNYEKAISGLSENVAARVGAEYSSEAKDLYNLFKREGITQAEQRSVIRKGIQDIVETTKSTQTTAQTIGALGSTFNEAAIEAINNSKDWAELEKRKAEDEYRARLETIKRGFYGTAEGAEMMVNAAEEYQRRLAAIEEGRAKMGNADFLWNVPILMASNLYQLGRLYTRGFDSTRREMGSLFNGHMLSGKAGSLATDKTRTGAIVTSLLKTNTEGMEEMLQRVASDGSGKAVTEAVDRFMQLGTDDTSKLNVDNYIAGFGKALAENLGDPKAWEEYFIGAVSAAVGMPVFGAQTRNAYLGKNGVFGLAGGIKGHYDEYMDARDNEIKVADYLNKRVNDPESSARKLYRTLRIADNYDDLLEDALLKEDKRQYLDLEFEKLISDISGADASGHLDEYMELVGFAKDYTDKELDEIVTETSKTVSAEDQKLSDTARKAVLQNAIAVAERNGEEILVTDYQKELDEIDKRLKDDEEGKEVYKDKLVGPFIDVNGQMNVTDPERMREILNRNRNHLLETIKEYRNIRNQIDVSTNGALDDKQLNFLTLLNAKIYNYEERSGELAEYLVDTINTHANAIKLSVTDNEEEVANAQVKYDNALEDKKQGAKKKLDEAKVKLHNAKVFQEIVDYITEKKQMTDSERREYERARGQSTEDSRRNRRNKYAVEMEALFTDQRNLKSLIYMIDELGLPSREAHKLHRAVADLCILANDKIAYNEEIKKHLGDPQKSINEAFQNSENRLSKEERDNKVEELALRIKKADTMLALDNIMRDVFRMDRLLAKEALKKAKESGDENTRSLVTDYEKSIEYLNAFSEQIIPITDPNIKESLDRNVHNQWERALVANEESFFDTFVFYLNEAADGLSSSDNPIAKETGTTMKNIIKNLKSAINSTTTRKDAKEKTADEENKEKEAAEGTVSRDAFAAAQALAKANAEEAAKAAKNSSRDNLIKEIVKEYNNNSRISKELSDKVEEFNKENSDNRIDLSAVLQDIVDGKFSNDEYVKAANQDAEVVTKENEQLGEEDYVREEMQQELGTTYKSDYVTLYNVGAAEYRQRAIDGLTESQKALQSLLEVNGAYSFIDTNLLGYIWTYYKDRDRGLPIHVLRTTDSTIDNNDSAANTVLLLAIEINKDVREGINAGFKNNRAVNSGNLLKPIEIDGKSYQLIGCATFDISNSSTEVKNGFANFQEAVFNETREEVDKQKGSKAFVVSGHKLAISNIFTGRLEKKNSEEDYDNSKVSLYEFMTSQQGSNERSASLEWTAGNKFHFGVVVNQGLNASSSIDSSNAVMPNEAWARKSGNNGAILLFVPRPDGRLYPVRATRRTVSDWWNSKTDNKYGKTGHDIIIEERRNEATGETSRALADLRSNSFIDGIIQYLKTIYESGSDVERIKAKEALYRYFTFTASEKKKAPIYFSGSTVRVLDKEFEITDDSSLVDFVDFFFTTLSEQGSIKFSIPSPTLEEVDGRAVVESGVFEIGLKGFYNFNANFTLVAVDGKGEKIISENTGSNNPNNGGQENALAPELTINGVTSKYTITREGDILKGDSLVTDEAERNIVVFFKTVNDGHAASLKEFLVKKRYSNDYIARKILEKISTGEYYIDSSGRFICIKRNSRTEIVDISSEQGKKIVDEIEDAITKFANDNVESILEWSAESNSSNNNDNDNAGNKGKPGEKPDINAKKDGPVADLSWLNSESILDLDSSNPGPSKSLQNLMISNRQMDFIQEVYKMLKQNRKDGKFIDEVHIYERLSAFLEEKDLEKADEIADDLEQELNCGGK